MQSILRSCARISSLASLTLLALTGCGGGGNPDFTDDGRFPSAVGDGFKLHDLGRLPTVEGETEDFTFHATAETRAFHVVGVTEPGTFLVLLHAVSPDGTVLARPDAPAGTDPRLEAYSAGFPGSFVSALRSAPRPRAAAVLIPNTPTISMQPGDWSFRFGVYKTSFDLESGEAENTTVDTAVHVGVVERLVDPPTTGTINLTLSFGPGSAVSAATAPSNATLQAALAQIDKSLGTVGVHVGDVTYRDAPDVPALVDLGGPSCLGGPGTEEAFDKAPEAPAGTLHLVFTDKFSCFTDQFLDLGYALAGVSNGVPGIPFAARDGMLVSTNLMMDFPHDWSLVLAHELSHFLGLFHTCEGVVDICDTIPDTPEGDKAMENLMFPNVSAVTSDGLTPQQGGVVRLSPLVHPM